MMHVMAMVTILLVVTLKIMEKSLVVMIVNVDYGITYIAMDSEKDI